MSHELRTPMNAVMGYTQLLRLDEHLTETQTEFTDEILTACTHLLGLIDELLDMSRIESGNMTIELESINILPVLDESIRLISNMAREHEIDIVNNFSGAEQCNVIADAIRLKEVFLNVLSNAIKYGRPNTSVTISGDYLDNGFFRLVIADQGTDEQRIIFEPFETGCRTHHSPGHGYRPVDYQEIS